MEIIPNKLAIENEHPRDKYVHFDEGPHIYTVNGEGGYISVTTLNQAILNILTRIKLLQIC